MRIATDRQRNRGGYRDTEIGIDKERERQRERQVYRQRRKRFIREPAR
jgi:hypothetical protein